MLARAGHSVVIVDSDPKMLAIAQDKLSCETVVVCSRVELVQGDGEDAANLISGDFDLACCHSVLMYQYDPVPILQALVNSVRQNGLISVLSLNTEARAMRCGLQGRWREAIASLEAGIQVDNQYIPSREHSREDVTQILEEAGARVKMWYGVGVFTDHFTEQVAVEDPAEVYLADWLAGTRDPYRQVARCFHLIAERL
jgi:S-adenosylmethionine-dependent methyltransferase